MRRLTLTRPDDWHIHLRDGDYLSQTVKDAAARFGRAIVMPNLSPPVVNVQDAERYRAEILQHVPRSFAFEPLMTLYLTPQTVAEDIVAAGQSPFIAGCKLYPAGATTNSEAGVSAITQLYPIFEAMQTANLPLLIHGEVTTHSVDIFDREARFIDESLAPLIQQFPELKVVFEHITTQEAAQFVADQGPEVAATITVHHLLYNRTDMLGSGMKPLLFCLPILKRDQHRQALLAAATSGNPAFFLGTDSAPHPRSSKENACGCAAGCYTAHAGIELYAEVFDAAGKLDRLEAFASHFGPDFYGLPRNPDKIVLEEIPWIAPKTLPFGNELLMPLRGGETIAWRLASQSMSSS